MLIYARFARRNFSWSHTIRLGFLTFPKHEAAEEVSE